MMVVSTRAMDVAVGEFFGAGFADVGDGAREIQVFIGHGMIEIHGYGIVVDGFDHALHGMSGLGLQGEAVAYLNLGSQVAGGVLENGNVQIHHIFGIGSAVAIFGAQTEGKFIAHLQADQILFEMRKEATSAHQKYQRMLGTALVHDLAIFIVVLEFVMQGNNFVVNNYHLKHVKRPARSGEAQR